MIILHFRFWLEEAKKPKRATGDPYKGNKFCILDEIKHNLKNFVFHHSKVQ
jgi:hypothetical protein